MKAHRTDGVSLTFGLVFLVFVGWYVAARLVDLNLPMVGWTVAGGLILLGLLGLVGALRAGRTRPDGGAGRTAATAGGPSVAAPGAPLPGARVADADRAPVAEQLRVALEDGRLSFTEYNERLQSAYVAVTYEELDRVLDGLDTPRAPDGPGAGTHA